MQGYRGQPVRDIWYWILYFTFILYLVWKNRQAIWCQLHYHRSPRSWRAPSPTLAMNIMKPVSSLWWSGISAAKSRPQWKRKKNVLSNIRKFFMNYQLSLIGFWTCTSNLKSLNEFLFSLFFSSSSFYSSFSIAPSSLPLCEETMCIFKKTQQGVGIFIPKRYHRLRVEESQGQT